MVHEVMNMSKPIQYDSTIKEFYAKALGDYIMKYIKTLTNEDLLLHMQMDAVAVIAQIKDILDDESLDDLSCFRRIDAIVSALHESGISTTRHDF